MKLSPEQLAEHDEVVKVVTTDAHGGVHEAEYKLNHHDKSVMIKSGPEDSLEWRATNGNYEAVLKSLGRPSDGSKPAEFVFDKVEPVAVKY